MITSKYCLYGQLFLELSKLLGVEIVLVLKVGFKSLSASVATVLQLIIKYTHNSVYCYQLLKMLK